MARQELTLKQQKFIKYYVECANITEAAEKAGYKGTSRKSLCEMGRETLEKLGYKIKPILAARGLDGFKFSEVLADGLALPAKHPTRHKYLETFGKVADFFAPEKHEFTGKDGTPIKTETTVELDIAKRIIDDERASKLAHALLESLGVNPGGNGNAAEPGRVGASTTPDTPEPKAG